MMFFEENVILPSWFLRENHCAGHLSIIEHKIGKIS